MAIFRNREVQVHDVLPIHSVNTVVVHHKDGMTERANLSEVHFTDAEKKRIVGDNPNPYENLNTASDKDLESVRNGVAPTYDPAYVNQAKDKNTTDKSLKMYNDNLDQAKKDVEKEDKSTSNSKSKKAEDKNG